MNKDRFRIISVIITITILITLVIQGYWNYWNYQLNKKHFINDVQQALDQAVESYFANEAKTLVFKNGIVETREENDKTLEIVETDTVIIAYSGIEEIEHEIDQVNEILSSSFSDTTVVDHRIIRLKKRNLSAEEMSFDRIHKLKKMATEIAISIQTDTIDINRLGHFLDKEFQNFGIAPEYKLLFEKTNSQSGSVQQTNNDFVVSANTAYLPPDRNLSLLFSNNFGSILARGIIGILVSLLSAVVIIASLIYLYQFIKNQKEIADIKNDLISNITHEFKTPIATVSTALESIEKFNEDSDPEKTKKYLNLSGQQLTKLNAMVEKLLDTATLEEKVTLNTDMVDLSRLVHNIVGKFSVLDSNKVITSTMKEDITLKADPFLLENAISNLLDNAIKHGGDKIDISTYREGNKVGISVMDDGGGISSTQKERLFEKFYRIPTGNRHDVKGFGIGLYYAKTIVEKHGGIIRLDAAPERTEFKILI